MCNYERRFFGECKKYGDLSDNGYYLTLGTAKSIVSRVVSGMNRDYPKTFDGGKFFLDVIVVTGGRGEEEEHHLIVRFCVKRSE